jgi:bifunctional non-homologous end joining protein LigD
MSPPSVYRPMLASAATAVPRSGDWLFEPKWDGFRAIATVCSGETTLTSRGGLDLGGRFPTVVRAISGSLAATSVVLDGEICALDDRGRSSFTALQQGQGTLVFVAFDVLELGGRTLIGLTLEERVALLDQVIAPGTPGVLVSPRFDDGEALFEAAAAQRLEGVVAKRRRSTYQAGRRSGDWLKVKIRARQELVVVGWTEGQGQRSVTFGALVLAVQDGGRLRHAGNVGSGFSDAELVGVRRLLEPLARASCPLAAPPAVPRAEAERIRWVEPRLLAEVEFTEWTPDGKVRAPVYLGLRDDKPAEDIRRERRAIEPELRRGKRTLRLSNLDKPFWPAAGITKGDLLAYYRDVAPVLVPHLRGRPFTMRRHPDGWEGKHFFQKQAPSHMPEWIRRVPFPASTREGEKRTIEYAVVDDDLALLWMVNMGCIDMHAWTARADLPDRPDWVTFDLDPSPDAGFAETVEVALLVKEALDLAGLASFPKTTGSRGIHVLVPIARRHSHADAREFAGIVAGAIVRSHPGLATTEWTKAKRKGVLIDANQNGPGRTTASVYSVRPRAEALVSTPLRWDEVGPALDPASLTMDVVLDRVAREGDLFAGVLRGGQSLAGALRALG